MSNRARNRIDKRRVALELASAKPRRFCDACGLNEAEHMACEEPDCGQLIAEARDTITTKAGERVDLRAPWMV